MRELSIAEMGMVAGGYLDRDDHRNPRNDRDIPAIQQRLNLDGDGDHDHFDRQEAFAQHVGLVGSADNPLMDPNNPLMNNIHEFFEDVGELFDTNPTNDSFSDGGNGSGNETPGMRPLPRG
jgi:hypothetical protein